MQDWQIPLGRRFRALKLWFVLRSYGTEKLKAYLRHHISLAEGFAAKIQSDSRFALAAPQKFSLVCFTLAVSHLPKTQPNIPYSLKTNLVPAFMQVLQVSHFTINRASEFPTVLSGRLTLVI